MTIEELESLKRFLEENFILTDYDKTYEILCAHTDFTDEELLYANSLKKQQL